PGALQLLVDKHVGADVSSTPPIHRPRWISQKPHQKETPLLKEKTYLSSEKSRNTHISHVKTYKTPAGPLFLRTCCTPSFVEGLKANDGLRAFARHPEREHNLLLSIAQQPENRLTLAHTATGTIVGQATLAPLDGWWQDISNAEEGINRFFQRLLQSDTLPGL